MSLFIFLICETYCTLSKKLYVIREQNDKTHIDKQIHLYGYSTNQMFDIRSILSHYWMISNKNNLVRCY